MNKAAKVYLREIRKRLPCSRSVKAEFLRQLEDEVFLYCGEHEEADFAALAAHFGTPEEVANSFLCELGTNTVRQYLTLRKRVLYAAAGIVLTVVILTSAVEIYTSYKQQQALDSYYIESITYQGDVLPYMTGPTYSVEYYYSEKDCGILPVG